MCSKDLGPLHKHPKIVACISKDFLFAVVVLHVPILNKLSSAKSSNMTLEKILQYAERDYRKLPLNFRCVMQPATGPHTQRVHVDNCDRQPQVC